MSKKKIKVAKIIDTGLDFPSFIFFLFKMKIVCFYLKCYKHNHRPPPLNSPPSLYKEEWMGVEEL